MKRILLSFFLLLSLVTFSFADKWPSPQGYVNDFAQVVPDNQRQALESFLGQVEQQTGAQISVVTVPSVDGGDIDGAAVDLFKTWGIGQKGKDNGVLILAAIQDRKMRIEVGYGLESVITDGTAGDIIRENIRPAFKQGDYGGGLTQGAVVAAQMIAQSEGVTLSDQPLVQNQGRAHPMSQLIVFGIFVLFILLTRGWGLLFGSRFYGGGWGGGGFGGSSGGGGFGGFGGGGSGGGGASGGW